MEVCSWGILEELPSISPLGDFGVSPVFEEIEIVGEHKTPQFIIYHEAHNDIRCFPCPDKPKWHAWCMEKDVNVIEMTESLGGVGRVKGQRFTTCLEPSYLQGLYTKHVRSNKQFSKFCHPTPNGLASEM